MQPSARGSATAGPCHYRTVSVTEKDPVPQYPFPEPGKPGNLRACDSCPCLMARVTDPVKVSSTSCSVSVFLILFYRFFVLQLKTPARRAPTQPAPPPLQPPRVDLGIVTSSINQIVSNVFPLASTQNIHLLLYFSCESRQASKQDNKLPCRRPGARCEPRILAVSHARPNVVSITYAAKLPPLQSTTTRRLYERVMKTSRGPSLPTITPGFVRYLARPSSVNIQTAH
ncbi:hypothetical protein LZ30DRAFT_321411 [Colletotrichum cereale]|nr:hypothetical protein LZ30DRAFT_321411 [Colletotrichum cereale]